MILKSIQNILLDSILAAFWKQLAYCLVYVRANRQTLSKAVAINENEIVYIVETDKQPRSYIIQF